MYWPDYRWFPAAALCFVLGVSAVVIVEAQQNETKTKPDQAKSSPSDEKATPSATTKPSEPAVGSTNTAKVAAPESQIGTKLVTSLTIFVLAIFVGFEVIAKVPPTLHTPLMSGSNAISGITLVGAVVIAGWGFHFASFIGFLAVIMATINVVGGFAVTHRMLAMFHGKQNR